MKKVNCKRDMSVNVTIWSGVDVKGDTKMFLVALLMGQREKQIQGSCL